MQNTTTNDNEYACYVGLEQKSRQVNGANKSRSHISKQQAIQRQSKKTRVKIRGKTNTSSDSGSASSQESDSKQKQSPKQKKGFKKPNQHVSLQNAENEVYEDAQVEYDVKELNESVIKDGYREQIFDDYMSYKAELEYRYNDTTEPVDHYRESLLIELIKEYDDMISTCKNVEMRSLPENDLLCDLRYLAIRDEMLEILRDEHLKELEIMYSIVTHCNGIRFGSNDLVVVV